MLNFTEISLQDRQRIDPFLQMDGAIMSDRCFSSLYIWGEHYGIETCVENGFLFVKSVTKSNVSYYMPLGSGDFSAAIAEVEADAVKCNLPWQIAMLTEEGKNALEGAYPGKYNFAEKREEFDYVYNTTELIDLTGKKLHSKRNYINRFLAENEDRWEYCDVDPEVNHDEIVAFLHEWCTGHDDEGCKDYHFEYSAIMRALEHYAELRMLGGMLRLDGKIIAFTMASPQNDRVMDILIEKADAEIAGAYQMINHEFALRCCEDYKLINREEDLGIEGLRRAKLSYQPISLTEKYAAIRV